MKLDDEEEQPMKPDTETFSEHLQPVISRRTVLAGLASTVSLIALRPVVAAAAISNLENYTRMTSTHFGSFTAEVKDGIFVKTIPFAGDPYPSKMIEALPDRVNSDTRIRYPMVRAGFLEKGHASDTTKRGAEPFVRVSWDKALDLVASELKRVKEQYGNEAIFGGSNGWRNAGKLHDPQKLLKRFLGGFGGFTNGKGGYSWAASKAILPHVLGDQHSRTGKLTTYKNIIENTKLIVLWGTTPLKNGEIMRGGGGEHTTRAYWHQIKKAAIETVIINPMADEEEQFLNHPQWIKVRPNTDTAMMLGMAHTLYSEGLHDEAFLKKYVSGFSKFLDYLTGKSDGQPKDAEWAAAISEVDANVIRELARKMAKTRSFIMGGPALQRGDHGEQPFWMIITLSAMLGQIGLPGGGFGFGYGYYNGYGQARSGVAVKGPGTGKNPVKVAIPTARITDLLLNPGDTIDFNGKKVTYPDIKLVYWAGGNLFTHQQDTNKLLKAWQRPETTIIHEPWWTASAKLSDIVLPANTPEERNDIARRTGADNYIFAMQKVVEPLHESRSDYDIFTALAARLGFEEKFTEGRDEMAWIHHMYEGAEEHAAKKGLDMPDFDTFWKTGHVKFPEENVDNILYEGFRKDPVAQPLGTPSGKIEIYSPVIAKFAYDDAPPHPTWIEPFEWLGSEKAKKYPLNVMSPHPKYRLHSQLNNTVMRELYEVNDREPMWINPKDAEARGIRDGDVVRIFNDRGQFLAGAVVTDRIRPDVIRVDEGAWYDPAEPGKIGSLDKHGAVNTISHDQGTSKVGQGSSAKTILAQVEKYTGAIPEVTAFTVPEIIEA